MTATRCVVCTRQRGQQQGGTGRSWHAAVPRPLFGQNTDVWSCCAVLQFVALRGTTCTPPLLRGHLVRLHCLCLGLCCTLACHACTRAVLCCAVQLAVMRAKDVAKQQDWGHRMEVRECPADLASDPDIPVVLTMLSNATGAWCGLVACLVLFRLKAVGSGLLGLAMFRVAKGKARPYLCCSTQDSPHAVPALRCPILCCALQPAKMSTLATRACSRLLAGPTHQSLSTGE
jgi:hypothetical protein